MEGFNKALGISYEAICWLKEWNTEAEIANYIPKTTRKVVDELINTSGMTLAHSRDFKRATPIFTLDDETVVKHFINPVQVKHIFLSHNDKMIFGGYVGWIHNADLNNTLSRIRRKYAN